MRHADPLAEGPGVETEPPMETCDEGDAGELLPQACPLDLLGAFCLLMAAQGRRVSATRMLTDRDHAMWQLARARTSQDEELRRLATRLFVWICAVGAEGRG